MLISKLQNQQRQIQGQFHNFQEPLGRFNVLQTAAVESEDL